MTYVYLPHTNTEANTHTRTQFQSYTLLCLTGSLFLGQVKESMGRNLQGRLKNPPLPYPHPGLCGVGACTLQYMCSLSLPQPRPLFNPSPLPLSIAVPCLTTLFLPPTRSGSNTISCLIKFCCVWHEFSVPKAALPHHELQGCTEL